MEEKVARLEKEAADTRREAANYRTKAKEGAAAAAELEKIRESQKTEAEKIQERAAAAEKRASDAETELMVERIARRHKITDDDMDLLGTGTEDQIEARAKKVAAKNAAAAGVSATAPPSEKPIEKLRPGATSSEKDLAPQDAYPAHWKTK
jgi:chromosome segregation ATPase